MDSIEDLFDMNRDGKLDDVEEFIMFKHMIGEPDEFDPLNTVYNEDDGGEGDDGFED